MKAMDAVQCPLPGAVRSFLDFCRVEKGLAVNSLRSYEIDLDRLSSWFSGSVTNATQEDLTGYVESLYGAGLSARSIARHMTTLRNFFSFLLREGEIDRDPSELLVP